VDEEDGRSAGKGIQVSKKAMRSIDFLSKNLSKTFCFKAKTFCFKATSILLYYFVFRGVLAMYDVLHMQKIKLLVASISIQTIS